MKQRYTHAFAFILIIALAFAPVFVAAGPSFVPADGPDMDDILTDLLENGAELAAVNIDSSGVPAVIYGRLGIPTSALNLDDPMFDDCIALAMLGVNGEMLPYLMNLMGMDMGGSSSSGFSALQFGDDSGPSDILDMLGTEFRIVGAAYLNLQEGVAAQRMGSVLSTLTSTFGFGFYDIFSIRVDQSMFQDENMTLPFDSLDLFIYGINADYAATFDAVLSVFGSGGFGDAIDRSTFLDAASGAAGMLVIPDMQSFINLMDEFMGGDGGDGGSGGMALASDSGFSNLFPEGMPTNITGPLGVGAVAYIGDQVVSSSTTEIGVASLIGATSDLTPMNGVTSMVLVHLPSTSNITSVTPYEDGFTMVDENSSMVIWNATHYGTQSDYVIHFDSDDFPPLVTIEREFSPTSTTPGGSTTVTVTVTNKGDSPINNVTISDVGFLSYYTTISVSGDTTKMFTTLGAGESQSMTYTVTFQNEGTYKFDGAQLTYTYNGEQYSKVTPDDGFTVMQSAGGVFTQMIGDGWPYTGGVIALIALVGVWQIVGIFKRRQ
ncbi:MAG: hypothetical protein K9W43_12950 [Candidatus Thorarchaeota archaeon]|nr:hypothetical protein [Candidatus Thorarchaeota archaeon]